MVGSVKEKMQGALTNQPTIKKKKKNNSNNT